jgi:hypothetical protein
LGGQDPWRAIPGTDSEILVGAQGIEVIGEGRCPIGR